MRIIRTEYYFPELDLGKELNRKPDIQHKKMPGYSIVWFRANKNNPTDVSSLISITLEGDHLTKEDFRIVISNSIVESLAGVVGVPKSDMQIRRIFADAAQEVIDGGFVIERSPPEMLSFSALIAKVSPVAFGVYVGWITDSIDRPLLIVSIPAGIVLMGAAAGVARGLNDGLHIRISDLIAGRPQTSRAKAVVTQSGQTRQTPKSRKKPSPPQLEAPDDTSQVGRGVKSEPRKS
jgi:hypothetical protein